VNSTSISSRECSTYPRSSRTTASKRSSLRKQALQLQVPFGRQKLLHQLEGRREVDRVRVAQHQFPTQRRQEVRLAAPRQPKHQQVLRPLHEPAVQQRRQHPPHLRRQLALLEVPQVLPDGSPDSRSNRSRLRSRRSAASASHSCSSSLR
jgi:hypothetical protein